MTDALDVHALPMQGFAVVSSTVTGTPRTHAILGAPVTDRIAFVLPGQGSHSAGMASAWLPYADAMFEDWSDAADLDLVEVADDADRVGDSTRLGQPSIAAVSLAATAALADAGVRPDVVAGHSLGELTAATVAGVFTPAEGISLAAARGRAMGEACAANPGTMAAAVRIDSEQVAEIVSAIDDVVVANANGQQQTVLAGTPDGIEAATAAISEAGGRALPLPVEGAFHSPAMEPAVDALRSALDWVPVRDPRFPLVSGTDGHARTSGDEIRSALVDGVLSPVRWTDVQRTLVDRGVALALEVGPGAVLKGLLKRGAPDIEVISVATPDDVDAAVEAVARVRGDDVARSTADLAGDLALVE